MRKVLVLSIFMFSFYHLTFAFTVINQTDSEKFIKIEEAYRPKADKPGELKFPIPFKISPHKFKIPRKSIYTFDLVKPCSIILVTFIEKKGKKSNHKVTSMTSCYESYNYGDQTQTLLTDDWWLVIYNPKSSSGVAYPFDASQRALDMMNKKRGYGVKCLHPKLLEKVTSLDYLSEELL